MAYDVDVLITFAEKDNEAAKKSDAGWVSAHEGILYLDCLESIRTGKLDRKSRYEHTRGRPSSCTTT